MDNTFIISTVTFLAGTILGWVICYNRWARKALARVDEKFDEAVHDIKQEVTEVRNRIADRIKS